MARRWLVKTEPNTYSYDDLAREGRTVWDGVRNNAAAVHLKAMTEEDEVFVYHSGDDKAVVGIAKVERAAFPDASDADGRFVAVELSSLRKLANPVALSRLKAEAALKDMVMLKQGRLSVAPVTDEEWKAILRLAGE